MARKNYTERKMKYFTPPSTFENLWMEFYQSLDHVKKISLDFIMALSNILKAVSDILNISCEIVELVFHFLLSIVNVIWLIVKIILVMGETIKALGVEEPSKAQNNAPNYGSEYSANTNLGRKDTLKTDLCQKDFTSPSGSNRKDSFQPDNSSKGSLKSDNITKENLKSYSSRKDFTIQPGPSKKGSFQSDNRWKDSLQSDNIKKDSLQTDSYRKESDSKKRNSVQFDLSKNTVHFDSLSDDKKLIRTNSDDLGSVNSAYPETGDENPNLPTFEKGRQRDSKGENTKRHAQHIYGLYGPPLYIGHALNIRHLSHK